MAQCLGNNNRSMGLEALQELISYWMWIFCDENEGLGGSLNILKESFNFCDFIFLIYFLIFSR
jgi:hypothetical protein